LIEFKQNRKHFCAHDENYANLTPVFQCTSRYRGAKCEEPL